MNRQFLHEALSRGENFPAIEGKAVAMAGCGAIGSWAATFLARMGIQNFRLIDKDRVEIHNVSTQTFTPANVGQHKTRALQEQLYRISKARCESQPVELTSRNLSLLRNADLIICSFDNQASRALVKKACVAEGSPCLFAGMNGRESYFEVIWAENYKVPGDPEHAAVDPCEYPLSTPLVASTAAAAAEIAMRYLVDKQKRSCRTSFGEVVR